MKLSYFSRMVYLTNKIIQLTIETEMKNFAGDRCIFDGNIKFDDSETKHIMQFKAYTKKHDYMLKPL